MKKTFQSFKRKKPVIRDQYLFNKGCGRSTFEYTFLWGSNTISLTSFAQIWFKYGIDDELRLTPRVWFSRVNFSNNHNSNQLVVVSITNLVNLIYGKKPKAKEWNQIKQFLQSNRTAIQRHWSQETDSIGLFKELTHNC